MYVFKMLAFVIIVALFTGAAISQPMFMDDAFKANTSGLQVVETVVDIITSSCIVENEVFLRRVAHVETNYGDDPQTYSYGNNGGIWNVNEEMFKQTKNNSNLLQEYIAIKDKLNIDWSNVTWPDLRQPINSALAVTLLLKLKNFRLVPENLELQATIWQSLNPARNQAFRFVSQEYDKTAACDSTKMLDLVFVLEFQQLSPFDLKSIQNFMKTLLSGFTLDLNSTRVGIVTKRQARPTAAWYLNSQRAGYSVINSLPALVYDVGGPTTVGDALHLTSEEMFNVTNGARVGSSKVVILLTDNVTQPEYAQDESKKLKEKGVHLIVLKVSNYTYTSDIDQLVENPACINARPVTSFSSLSGLSERLTSRICKVSSLLKAGQYTFPCDFNLSARLPDTSKAFSILVLPSAGNITIFAAKMYRIPDEHSHDARVVSSANNATVLYIRGVNPVYLQVRGQEATCTGTYQVEIKESESFQGKGGLCFVANTVRKCNDLKMDLITHDVVLVRDSSVPPLCDYNNHSLERYPHPVDPGKFYVCDRDDIAYLGLCPVNMPKCIQFSSGCEYTNPCEDASILGEQQMFNDPCAKTGNYITCTRSGVAEVMDCPVYRIWNEDTQHCVFEFVHDPKTNTFYTNMTNPCTHAYGDHEYFPFPTNPKMFIFCNKFGDGYASSCQEGVWNEQMKTCTQKTATLIG